MWKAGAYIFEAEAGVVGRTKDWGLIAGPQKEVAGVQRVETFLGPVVFLQHQVDKTCFERVKSSLVKLSAQFSSEASYLFHSHWIITKQSVE
jgi:hypothetical protein